MAKFKQQYSTNGINASTAGRVGQVTSSGRFTGARVEGNGGRYVSRDKQYRNIRAALGLSAG